MKTIFSGVQPSGNLHIGNYIGALSQWVKLQEESEAIFCIVDLHAITVPQEPKALREKILEIAALYLAVGIDPAKAHIFIQSENSDHVKLAWVLNTITPFGQLERMTQFKEKGEKHGENVGLFDYPVLMAADILLYQTDEVPVGEDQKQHLELARDLAQKFNSRFGQVFKLPNPLISPSGTARIMSLSDPTKKMSKSDNDPLGTINLLDSEEQIREKIKKAVTDSATHISKDHGSEAISNLLTIYAAFKNQSLESSLSELEGKSYSEFKNLLADLVVSKLSSIQQKYNEIRADENSLMLVLNDGRDFAIEKSQETMKKVLDAVGLGRPIPNH
ncbi:MAG: tryptophan--tRNA ligase [Candidatus Levybacteria bacterium]|nr:tryptophan--tRNA ligase [Candidatus Levybacteria bacterium]